MNSIYEHHLLLARGENRTGGHFISKKKPAEWRVWLAAKFTGPGLQSRHKWQGYPIDEPQTLGQHRS